MRRVVLLTLLFLTVQCAVAQIYGRMDFYLTSTQGQAISGGIVTVYNQSACGAPATTLAALYTSTSGGAWTGNPGQATTNGFGHASAYAAINCYTVIYSSPYTGTQTYIDQVPLSPSSGGSAIPNPPAFSVQAANAASSGLTSDPTITLDTTNHILNVGGTCTGCTDYITSTDGINLEIGNNVAVGGTVTSTAVNGEINAGQLPGASTDIGNAINTYITANGADQAFYVPAGTYNYATGISITQSGSQHVNVRCASRSSLLHYTGSGDAFYTTSGGSPTAQVAIQNCAFSGTSSAANGIHAFFDQNLRLTNVQVSGFSNGNGVFGQGLIDSVMTGNDILSNKNNLYFVPDTGDSFGANGNRVYGGSLQYASQYNYWDEGNLSVYGGDTGNILDGVTFEQSTNTPQFVVEGTWNDAIKNSYIEYINFPTSTANLFAGIVGNQSGSGYGSGTTTTAEQFQFINNYMITPTPGATFNTASLLAYNSSGLSVQGLTDEGAPNYCVSFYSSGSNVRSSSNALNCEWQTAAYQNPPNDGYLWVQQGQTISTDGWSQYTTGLNYNSIAATNIYPTGLSPSSAPFCNNNSGGSLTQTNCAPVKAVTCGTTTTCANTAQLTPRIVWGTVALSGGSAVIGSLTAFTATTSFNCTGTDRTSAAAVAIANTSTSSITITGTGTDTVAYQCVGN
jgi:hypothetical protein